MGAPLIERGTEAGRKERVVCWLGLFLFVCVCDGRNLRERADVTGHVPGSRMWLSFRVPAPYSLLLCCFVVSCFLALA